MILPRHWQSHGSSTTEAGADCCGQACEMAQAPLAALWICMHCGATVRLCGGGKRCVLPLGHEALPDFACHESRSGSQVPV